MLGPFVVILAQLVANYAYEPSPRGAVELLHVRLDPDSARRELGTRRHR